MKLSDLPMSQGEYFLYLEENGPAELFQDEDGDYCYRQPVKFSIEHEWKSAEADLINPPEYSEVTVYESNSAYLHSGSNYSLTLFDAVEGVEVCWWWKDRIYNLREFCERRQDI